MNENPKANRAQRDAESRQARLAALKSEELRRKRRLQMGIAAVAAVVVALVALVGIKLAQTPAKSAASSAAPSDLIAKLSAIPASTFDKVGAGNAKAPLAVNPAQPLTADGKPRVLYVGSEYCPFCAAERWGVVVALSRFGTFANLGSTTSSATDVYPSTATLSFHGSSFSSPYLSFAGFELQTNQQVGGSYAPLDNLSEADQKIVDTLDAPPYVPVTSSGAIPFIDIGGSFIVSGAQYDPGLLQGLSHQQIADQLNDPTSRLARSVDGVANVLSAALCRLTNQQPAAICASPGVRAGAAALPSS